MTMKFLAIGHPLPEASSSEISRLNLSEMEYVWSRYKSGAIREMYERADGRGVVLILELDDEVAARTLLDKLPLAQEHLIKVEMIELRPFSMLSALFQQIQ